MIITHYGLGSIKVQFGDTTLGFNPVSKESKYKSNKFSADIGLVSLNHPDMNGASNLNYGNNEAFIIDGPGEYEVKSIFVKGLPSKSMYGGKERVNTIYRVVIEGMVLCHLGGVSSIDIDPKTFEALESIDVLFVPIDGKNTLSVEEASKLAVKIGAKIVIPVNYDKDSLKAFLKEGGNEKAEEVDKLTLKKKDLDGKDGTIIPISIS